MTHLTVQQLSASLDGAVTGPSLELVARHLSACGNCRDRQARLARNDDALRRLLAPEVSEEFLEDLGNRSEEIAVAIARGVPPPAMTTSTPVLADEDPYAPSEPPLPERPELGRAGQLAQEAGYGRIGLKPTGSTQPPAADPAEAQRLMESLESASAAELSEFAGPTGRAPAAQEGPVFDLPAWIKHHAARQRTASSAPREVQKLKLVFEPSRDDTMKPSRGEAREPTSEARPMAPARETQPAAAARETAPVTPVRRSEPPPTPPQRLEPVPLPGPRGEWVRAPDPREPAYEPAPTLEDSSAYEPDPRERDAAVEYAAAPARTGGASYATRAVAMSALARHRGRGARGGLALHWVLASASVAALILVILTLQLVPAEDAGRGQATGRPRFRLPRLEFAGADSAATPAGTPERPALRSASTPAPVETVVSPVPRDVPPDSSAIAPADSIGDGNAP